MESLENQLIVITGGSSGLGKALALRLAKEKANIVLISRNEKKLQETCTEIQTLGARSSYICCDITSPDLVKTAFNEVLSVYRKIDILINNAGIWFEGPTVTHESSKVTELFETNIIGLIETTKCVIPGMKEAGHGQILNISSTAGVGASGDYGVYCSTKYAVRGFTDSLKLELQGTGIKVLGFYPGGVNTEIFKSQGFYKENEAWMMNVEDIAEIITFILKQPRDVVMDHTEVRKMM